MDITNETLQQHVGNVIKEVESGIIHTKKNMVLIDESAYKNMQETMETMYLLLSRNNTRRIFESLEQGRNEEFEEVEWDED